MDNSNVEEDFIEDPEAVCFCKMRQIDDETYECEDCGRIEYRNRWLDDYGKLVTVVTRVGL